MDVEADSLPLALEVLPSEHEQFFPGILSRGPSRGPNSFHVLTCVCSLGGSRGADPSRALLDQAIDDLLDTPLSFFGHPVVAREAFSVGSRARVAAGPKADIYANERFFIDLAAGLSHKRMVGLAIGSSSPFGSFARLAVDVALGLVSALGLRSRCERRLLARAAQSMANGAMEQLWRPNLRPASTASVGGRLLGNPISLPQQLSPAAAPSRRGPR